jgi:hypothetical protein
VFTGFRRQRPIRIEFHTQRQLAAGGRQIEKRRTIQLDRAAAFCEEFRLAGGRGDHESNLQRPRTHSRCEVWDELERGLDLRIDRSERSDEIEFRRRGLELRVDRPDSLIVEAHLSPCQRRRASHDDRMPPRHIAHPERALGAVERDHLGPSARHQHRAVQRERGRINTARRRPRRDQHLHVAAELVAG